MADNITVKDAAGNNIIVKTKDVGAGVECAQNVLSDATGAVLVGRKAATASLPAVLSNEDFAAVGALTETAPGTDTASSGLNGRLQRIAQRLTSMIALLPAALGSGGGLKVDGSGTALPVSQSGNFVVRTQDGAGTALTSATRGAQQALSVQIVDGSGTQITSFGGSGGTASNFGSAVPASGTAAGYSDGTNMQPPRVYDADTGGGTEYVVGAVERVPASGGSVTKTFGAGAVAAGTQRVTLASDDPAVSYTSRLLTGALPTAGGTASATTAQAVGGTYNSTPISLTDTQQAGIQLDANGRLLATSKTQDGAGNALTSATRGSERALSVQIVDGSGNQVTTFGGAGGTSSNVGSAVPSAATASGFSDGTNMQLARAFDADTGGGTEYVAGTVERVPASGGSVLKTFNTGTVAAGTQRITLATDDQIVTTIGAKTDAKSTATDTTAVSAISVLKQISASAQALVTALGGSLDLGAGAVDTNTQRVTIGTTDATAVNINNALVGDYEFVEASASEQTLGPTGATGDYLANILISPLTLSPGEVSVEDGSNTYLLTVFTGGSNSVTNLVPFAVPLGIKSTHGAWKINTGANVNAIAVGNFT